MVNPNPEPLEPGLRGSGSGLNLNLIEIQTDFTDYLQYFPEIQNLDQFPSMPHFQLSDGHHGKQLSASVMN